MLLNFMTNASVLSGLTGLVNSAISNWIGPVFFVVIATVAIILLWQRQLRGFMIFILLAAIAGLLIFFSQGMFGKNGKLTRTVNGLANQVETITTVDNNPIVGNTITLD